MKLEEKIKKTITKIMAEIILNVNIVSELLFFLNFKVSSELFFFIFTPKFFKNKKDKISNKKS